METSGAILDCTLNVICLLEMLHSVLPLYRWSQNVCVIPLNLLLLSLLL